MTHEINEADANIREIMRLRGLLEAARADAAALVAEFKRIRGMREAGLYGSARLEEMALLDRPHPGAALLARLDRLKVENAKLREWLRGELTLADADIDEVLARPE